MKVLRVSLFILAVTFIFSLWLVVAAQAQAQAQAQTACGKRADMVEDMRQIYGEVRRGYGVSISEGSVFEVWASDVTGTWTILKTYPNGVACVVEVGENWHDAEPTLTGDPA